MPTSIAAEALARRLIRRLLHLARWCLPTALVWCAAAHADGRLAATGGVTQIEGAAGGGLVPWALIAGYDTRDEVRGDAFYTHASTQKFRLDAAGVAIGIHDRVELSYAQDHFNLGGVVPGQTLTQDVFGAKWRVYGDALIDQDRLLPQIAIGALYKRDHRFNGIPKALGAQHGSDIEPYLAATKIWIDGPLGHVFLLDGTLRITRANQFGLLGFGGAQGSSRCTCFETSAAWFANDALAFGAEWRQKPNTLPGVTESAASDGFVAWIPNRHVALVAAWLDLGTIAGQAHQRGPYLSAKLDF
ncbi:MAG: DUF3034 family protein [Burkholderiales bacterium]|nr:DUF3034 family protein [Burkholderiales bacterium]